MKVRTAGPILGLWAIALTVFPGLVPAAQAETTPDTGDTAWMLSATVLVLMMTIPGLALFYGGMVRRKNVLATTMQSFAAACLMTVLWMIVGYSLAFGDGGAANAVVGGLDRVLLLGTSKDTLFGTIPESVFMTFRMTFATITPALICRALADRMKFSVLLSFLGAWMVLVYAPVCLWVWGGGFLADDGVLDFAGGTVVHINAGVAGLVAAMVLGPRHGFGSENMAPHNLVLSVIGASLLWVGWFGFNAGSALAANGTAGMAMAVTQIAAAAAALAWMVVEWMARGKPSVLGLIAGVACYFGATRLKNALGYDDSLDAFGVHGVGGIVGALLTGVFAIEAVGGTPGLIEGNPAQMMVQLEGIGATVVYCAIATWVILKAVDRTVGLRVDTETEVAGLDITLHGETVH